MRKAKNQSNGLRRAELSALPWAEGRGAVHAALVKLAREYEAQAQAQSDWVWLAALHVEEMGESQWALVRDIALHGLLGASEAP